MPTRNMPQNIEAEMSVLGVAFLDNKSALTKICEELYPEMFYSDANRKLFEAIRSCYDARIPVDITTIKEELDKKKNLSAIGGIDYISEVIDSVATAANLDYYIKIVKDKAVMRNLIQTATDIITNAYEEDEDISQTLDEAEKKILNVVKERQTSDFIDIKDAIAIAQENLEKRSKNGSDMTGVPSGFYDLDKATAGFHEGELIIVAARPGMGKTAFALNLAVAAAKSLGKKAVAVFNLEMPAEQLVNRMRSAVGQIDSYKIQTGQMSHEDWKRINEANSQLAETNIKIVEDAGITASEIKAKCRNLANTEDGLGLIIIDYLQLVTTAGRRPESRQQEVSEISRTFKKMAMELKVPVIALAQLSRSAEKRENNQPMLADLRESGSIEQDADLVLFIHRNDYYKAKTELNKEKNVPVDIIIAKHRKGSTGKFQLLFELNMSNFRNYLATEKEDENE